MADLSGEQLGPFAIQSLLGTGGFATVYRAHDSRLNDDVAIKILAENHALNAQTRERFIAEAHALRRISSPGVIQIYDIRETPDGRPYLVLEFADRGDLVHRRRELVANGWQPSEADLRLVIDSVADALDAIHAEALVHRDITPANVLLRSGKRIIERPDVALLDASERLLLSDMGLVKDMSDGSALTVGGGTAGFWAPEQQQQLTTVDHRTDIYAATTLVVWLLTGHAVGMTPNWRDLVAEAGWSTGLQNALGRSLSSNPDSRPQSITEWQDEVTDSIGDFAAVPTERLRDAATQLGPASEPPTSATAKTQTVASQHLSTQPNDKAVGSRNALKMAAIGVIAALAIGIALFFSLRDSASTAVEVQSNEAPTADATDLTADEAGDPTTPVPQVTVAATEPATPESISVPPTTVPADTAPPSGTATTDSIETFAFAMHPNGSQVIINEIQASPTELVVSGQVLNGRDFSTTIDFDTDNTFVVDDTQRRYSLLQGYDSDLDPGQIADFTLRFEAVDSASVNSVDLHLNDRNDVVQDIDLGWPGFVLDSIELGRPVAGPGLPDDLEIADSSIHPSGVNLQVRGISFADNHIAVGFAATNAQGRLRSVSSGNTASHLVDDLGNQYRLKFEGENRFLRLDDGEQLDGVFVFAGRVDPDATQLTLVMNAEESATDPATSNPKFEVGPWNILQPAAVLSLPSTISVDESKDHPNESSMTLTTISFGPTGTLVEVSVANSRSVSIRLNPCCETSYLLDDLGNQYWVTGALGNDDLEIERTSQVNMVLSFPGQIDAAASTIELVLNGEDENNAFDPGTWRPTFRFGPYSLDADPANPVVVTPPADFGSATSSSSQPVPPTMVTPG